MPASIDDVKKFWENNPLFTGEATAAPGGADFFLEHNRVYLNDVFAGHIPEKLLFPQLSPGTKVLDLGCGIGFWSQELLNRFHGIDLYSADLTQTALDMTEKRLALINGSAHLSIQNAEHMSFPDDYFDHVNCQGVIHHTPDTVAAVQEIARITKPGGTAYISTYYRNFILRNWPWLSILGKLLTKVGAGLSGRGRENIFSIRDVDEITRMYDGEGNPIGKSYSRSELVQIVAPYFDVELAFLNFFPARALPFRLPQPLHYFLSRQFGFMIHLSLRKKILCVA